MKWIKFLTSAIGITESLTSVVMSQMNRKKLEKLIKTNRQGMYFLIGWASFNIVGSAALYPFSEGLLRYFLIMNIGWNVVNFLLGAIGAWQQSRTLSQLNNPDSKTTLTSYSTATQNLLTFNAGLDVAYITAAAWALDRGQLLNSVMFKGFGASILVQALFLLCFDIVLAMINKNARGE